MLSGFRSKSDVGSGSPLSTKFIKARGYCPTRRDS